MTKQEYVEIIDMLEGAGFEAQKIEYVAAKLTGDYAPSYCVRFQRSLKNQQLGVPWDECVLGHREQSPPGTEWPDPKTLL